MRAAEFEMPVAERLLPTSNSMIQHSEVCIWLDSNDKIELN